MFFPGLRLWLAGFADLVKERDDPLRPETDPIANETIIPTLNTLARARAIGQVAPPAKALTGPRIVNGLRIHGRLTAETHGGTREEKT